MIQITTKTPGQIAAEFDDAFRAVKPIRPTKSLTQADRLAPYRKAILKQHRRGLSWRQIAEVMSRPPIAEPVTSRLLKRLFGAKKSAPHSAPPTPAPAR